MFREELLFLKNSYLDRLHHIPVFSQEAQDNHLYNGRIDNRKGAELIRRLLPLASYHEFFLCGPESMVSEVSRGLRSEGVPLAAIHWELFAASADAARERVRKHEERSRARGDRRSTVHVRLHGRRTTFELESDGENLLDRARALGLDAPFACKDGVCATCRARVVAGRVDMDVNQALTEDEVAAGYVLTCQSHPLSDVVEIDYDVLSTSAGVRARLMPRIRFRRALRRGPRIASSCVPRACDTSRSRHGLQTPRRASCLKARHVDGR
jgi:ring-1,2-phenylacetyl-CoA epoxidase subunit PaaE